MARPDAFDTLNPYATWDCLVCKARVQAEESNGVFRPASRYWHDDGVFCGPEHSLQYHDEVSRGTEFHRLGNGPDNSQRLGTTQAQS